MSLSACIADLLAKGRIRKGDGEVADRAYRRHLARLERNMAPEAAAAEASELALREVEYATALRARQAFLQITKQRRIVERIQAGDRYRTPLAIVEEVDAQRRAVLGRLHGRMTDVLFRHSRNLIGEARDKTGLIDLGRERFGEKTGNRSAAELAEAFGAAAEYGRTRFNRAGGNIGKREDWGLPTHHSTMKVRAVPYDYWRNRILQRIDLDRMTDDATGQPFTVESIEDALRHAWETIRSDGWSGRTAGGLGEGKLANRRADHRFFTFKSFEDWLAYHNEFGEGTIFDVMNGHLEGLARDIALMDVLGPNPPATVKWMQDWVRKSAATDPDPTGRGLDRARATEGRIEALYDVVSGAMHSPVNVVWARRMAGTRSFVTSALLGRAAITALSDVSYQALTRAFNGVPIMGALTGYLRMFKSLGGGERQRAAVRLGLVAEEASKMAASLNRYVDGTHTPELMGRISDAVLRVSGLSPWTQAGRWAFGMETLGVLADARGSSWNNLPGALRRMMERYGIDEPGWDAIRATAPYEHRGAQFLRPDDVEDEALGDAMLRMVLTETDYAVPVATARSRAITNFGTRPGTLAGEIVRNSFLFKSFAVSMVLNHGARMMSLRGTSRAAYAAGLIGTTTLLGFVALAASEAVLGRDVPDPTDPRTIGRAFLKGGGGGIYGDFLGASTNRFGGGFAETMAGPVVGLAGDVTRAAATIGTDAFDPERDANPGREAVKLARRYTPGGSIWYARLAFERFLLDELQQWADPDYYDSFQRIEDNARERGSEYWWRPGESAPDRAPTVASGQ